MEIKTIDGAILYTCDCKTIADALTAAVKSGANLREANLRGADLRGADLQGADLQGANLQGAYLREANLRGANLQGAYLREANLRGAYLREANLRGADLREANLRGANLRGAYLREADLRGANLQGAYLREANLRGAYLREANLRGANLQGAKNIPYIPLACPSDGEFIAWKKVGNKLVKLLIPATARRSSATTNKCRCDRVVVLAVTSLDEEETFDEVINYSYVELKYKVGEEVLPDSYDDNRWNECSNGIHFFINKQDAINY